MSRRERWQLGILVCGYIVILWLGQGLKYHWWGQGYDQIDYEQSIWNTTQGRFLAISHYRHTDHLWGMDFSPAMLLIVPFYALFPSAYTLMFFQALFTGLGALPVYALSRSRFKQHWAAMTACCVYLLYPSLQFVTMTAPWQPRTLAIPAIMAAFWFFDQRRYVWFGVMLLVTLTTRTDTALVVIAFGVLALIWRRSWQWWLMPIGLGVAWLYLSTQIIVPSFYRADYHPQVGQVAVDGSVDYAATWPGKSPQLAYYSHLGDSVGSILLNILTNPIKIATLMFTSAKLQYLFLLLLPLAFLPLLAPDVAILSLPIIGMNLLSTRVYQFTIREQYQALVIPGLILAAIIGMARLIGWLQRRNMPTLKMPWFLIGIVVLSGIINIALKNPVLVTIRYHEKPERIALMESFKRDIPPDGAVAATSFLAPHLLPREQLYYLPNAPMFPSLDNADYLFIDARSAAMRETGQLATFQNDPAWEAIRQQDDLWLFRRRSR